MVSDVVAGGGAILSTARWTQQQRYSLLAHATAGMELEMGAMHPAHASLQEDATAAPQLPPPQPPMPLPGDVEVGEGRHARLHWQALPALPAPSLHEMRAQAAGGCTTVMSIIAACTGGTHAAVSLGALDDPFAPLLLALVWTWALGALGCLLGLLFGDPGVIQRSEARCSPVPAGPIRDALLAGRSPSEVSGAGLPPIPGQVFANVHDASTGRSYCVRCLIWCVMCVCVCVRARAPARVGERASERERAMHGAIAWVASSSVCVVRVYIIH